MRAFLIWVLLATTSLMGTAIADQASVTPATAIKADELVKTLMPPSSQHAFFAIDASWEVQTSYLKLRPDAFVTVNKPSNEEKKALYKEVLYFAQPGTKDPNQAIKTVTYYPSGATYSEVDRAKNGQFYRNFFSNGLLRSYTHLETWKLLAGIGVEPITKKVNSISGGSGSLVVYEENPGNFETSWYRDGDIFLTEEHHDSRLSEVILRMGNDMLRTSRDEETLNLDTEAEFWTRTGNSVNVQIMDTYINGSTGETIRRNVPKKTDIRPMPLSFGGPPERLKAEEEEMMRISAEWKIVYPKRRKAFIDRFEKVLTESRQDWKNLNLEFIRDDAGWPKE